MTREHGTHARYVLGPGPGQTPGCRCDACRSANSAYERERKRRVAPPYVAAAQAREHVRDLMAAGIGLKRIAAVAGVSNGALTKLIYGTRGRGVSKRIRPETRDALLAVTPADAADGSQVDAARTWGHIDTLLDRGWTKTAIARAIGQTSGGLQVSRHRVQAGTARAIAALLDQPVPNRTDPWGNVIVADWTPDDDQGPDTAAHDEIDRYELPTLPAGLGDWVKRGPCRRPEVPTWLFFPGRGDNETTERAKAVCATCPVTAECLDAALANDEPGIWGGTSERERRQMRAVAS